MDILRQGFVIFLASLLILMIPSCSHCVSGTGLPMKFISSCEIDLNADGASDIAMIVETVRGWELIALIKKANAYDAFVLMEDNPSMNLSCHFGATVAETPAGEGKDTVRTIYKTPGAFLELSYPEGPSVAFFWNGSGFTEVWTSD